MSTARSLRSIRLNSSGPGMMQKRPGPDAFPRIIPFRKITARSYSRSFLFLRSWDKFTLDDIDDVPDREGAADCVEKCCKANCEISDQALFLIRDFKRTKNNKMRLKI